MRPLFLALLFFSIPGLYAQIPRLAPGDALSHVGERATVCGPIADKRTGAVVHGLPTFIDLGRTSPQPAFTIILWDSDAKNVGDFPTSGDVCVTGTITQYKSVPQIVLSNAADWFLDPGKTTAPLATAPVTPEAAPPEAAPAIPEPADPEPTVPAKTVPAKTDPASAVPAPAIPAPAEAAPTDAAKTDPAPADPAPADPAPPASSPSPAPSAPAISAPATSALAPVTSALLTASPAIASAAPSPAPTDPPAADPPAADPPATDPPAAGPPATADPPTADPASASPPAPSPDRTNDPPIPSSPSSPVSPVSPVSPYKIGPDDSLQITVWQEPNLSGGFLVRPDGMISLVLTGDVRAAGLTPMELASELTKRFTKFLQDPVVSVIVAAPNSQKIYVLGEVQHVGPIPMATAMSPLQAIAAAGGLTPYARPKKIYILRGPQGGQRKIPFNYKNAVNAKPNSSVHLLAGDTIVVP